MKEFILPHITLALYTNLGEVFKHFDTLRDNFLMEYVAALKHCHITLFTLRFTLSFTLLPLPFTLHHLDVPISVKT